MYKGSVLDVNHKEKEMSWKKLKYPLYKGKKRKPWEAENLAHVVQISFH